MYKIPAYRLDELKLFVEKFNRKAKKLNLPSLSFEVIGHEYITLKVYPDNPWSNETYKVKKLHIEIMGTIPVISGYRFIGTIDHAETVNIIRNASNTEVPEYYRTAPVKCDHCQTKRRRTNSFIIQEVSTGEYKQVGRNCLADYLRSSEVNSHVWYLTQLLSITDNYREDDDEMHHSGYAKQEHYYDLDRYMACVVRSVETKGWVSSSEARDECTTSTAANALNACKPLSLKATPKEMDIWQEGQPTPDNIALAQLIIQHIREDIGSKPIKTEFESNLIAIYGENLIAKKHIGYAASAYIVHQKHVEAELKRQLAPAYADSHVGKPGERIALTLKVTSLHYIDSEYGSTKVHNMIDAENHSFVWFASSTALEVGQTYTIKATIKNHSEYKGAKQTVLTRCKVVKLAA